MKELAEDYKTIWKKDRGLLCWMGANFLLNLWLFLVPFFSLDSSHPKIWARYSDIDNGYAQSDWWYLLGFSLIAIAMGIGHTLLAARLWTKRGKDLARLFLFISMIILVVGIRFLLNIVGEG
jgi:hypothetical protein